VGAAIGGFHDPGPPPEVTTNRCRREGIFMAQVVSSPRGARILVVAGHLDRGLGSLKLQIRGHAAAISGALAGCSWLGAACVEPVFFPAAPGRGRPPRARGARRAEKDHRILNLLPPEARQRLNVLGDNANQASVALLRKLEFS